MTSNSGRVLTIGLLGMSRKGGDTSCCSAAAHSGRPTARPWP